MFEVIFLIVLALVWIIFASVQDLRETEVANWLNFSLIIFALGFRFFYCLFSTQNFAFFYQGLIGLGIFFVLGNALYYGRMFAGGDAKLMIALGAILPFSENFYINIRTFVLFFILFLFVGAVYGLVWSMFLTARNFRGFKREFSKRLKINKKIIYPVFILGLILMILGFVQMVFFYFGILFFILPYLFLYAKSADECCMVKKIDVQKLREGDWLYRDVKIGRKVIKAKWDGLNKNEIRLIRKKLKVVTIRKGIAFVPVFLISFLILIYLWYSGWKPNFLWF